MTFWDFADWEISDDGEFDITSHFTIMLPDPKLDKNMMIRHCFLEVLDSLQILEYTRGYEGTTYDITIKRRKR